MNLIDQMLHVADAYAAHSGLAEATVSARFAGRGGRIRELRGGGDMGMRTIARIIQQFSDHWPEGAVWPEGIERPAPRERENGEAA